MIILLNVFDKRDIVFHFKDIKEILEMCLKYDFTDLFFIFEKSI